jgi:Holliday junction resolvase YEN1
MVYTAEAIRTHPDVRLTRGGLILIALLAGGDYDKVSKAFSAKFRSD